VLNLPILRTGSGSCFKSNETTVRNGGKHVALVKWFKIVEITPTICMWTWKNVYNFSLYSVGEISQHLYCINFIFREIKKIGFRIHPTQNRQFSVLLSVTFLFCWRFHNTVQYNIPGFVVTGSFKSYQDLGYDYRFRCYTVFLFCFSLSYTEKKKRYHATVLWGWTFASPTLLWTVGLSYLL
jgi:hypothetical protein